MMPPSVASGVQRCSARPKLQILSVAALSDLGLVLPVSEFNFSNKPKEFLENFSYGKIPGFEHAEGWKLFEGASIARYLCSIGGKVELLGTNAKEVALVDQWMHFAENDISGPTERIIHLIIGASGPFHRETLDAFAQDLHRALAYLESHLETRSSGYVASDALSLADLVITGVILNARRTSLGRAEVAQYPSIFAHFARVTEDERLKRFWGAETLPFVDVAVTEPIRPPSA